MRWRGRADAALRAAAPSRKRIDRKAGDSLHTLSLFLEGRARAHHHRRRHHRRAAQTREWRKSRGGAGAEERARGARGWHGGARIGAAARLGGGGRKYPESGELASVGRGARWGSEKIRAAVIGLGDHHRDYLGWAIIEKDGVLREGARGRLVVNVCTQWRDRC